MNDFRLIAIRPLSGCNPDYLKKLKPDFLFKFDASFRITQDDIQNPEKRTMHLGEPLSKPLYEIEVKPFDHARKIPVNLSAVVGKNGSGKSTLIELIFVSIYNHSVEKGILKSKSERDELEDQTPAQYEPNIKTEIFYKIAEQLYCLRIENGEQIDPTPKISKLYKYSENQHQNWAYEETVTEDFKHHFKDFFYTIAINYSLYGLNSDYLGDWIETLFHKNDSYQTPIVINPMRTSGNISVERENELVNQRLLSNILQPIKRDSNIDQIDLENSLRNLAPGKNAAYLQLTSDKTKEEKYKAYSADFGDDQTFTVSNSFYKQYTGSQIYQASSDTEQWHLTNYIRYKIKKICEKYPLYHKYLNNEPLNNRNEHLTNTEELINDLLKDKSHVTFKLKQAANLIRYYDEIQATKENGLINIEKYSKFIEDTIASKKDSEIKPEVIELIPPAIYDIEILFEDKKHSFEGFSSGEKQKVHSINSILYHLINLNSVFANENNTTANPARLNVYQHINIIFDEIELYFHPDLQRMFIYDLLESMTKTNPLHLWYIKGIQILFITHSPFILSDIPSNNILYLEANQQTGEIQSIETKGETFGANIHDLLAHDFFMSKGFMGELAKTKIQSAINHLQNIIKNPREEVKETEWNKTSIKAFIEIIGEPMIKKSMLDLYLNAYGENAIEAEIERLTKMLNKKEGGPKQ